MMFQIDFAIIANVHVASFPVLEEGKFSGLDIFLSFKCTKYYRKSTSLNFLHYFFFQRSLKLISS